MNAPAPAFSPPRVAPHLGHAFGGMWRLTYPRFLTPMQLLVTVALTALLGFLMYVSIRHGRVRAFNEWTAGVYFSGILPLLGFVLGAGAIRDEMKSGAVDYMLIRPVPRPAYVAFKFICHLACVQVVQLLPLGAVFAVGAARGIPEVMSALPGLLLGQAAVLTVSFAFGFLSGVLTSKYIVIGLVWGAIFEIGIGNVPTELSRLSITHQGRALIERFQPGAPAGFVPEQGAFGIVAMLVLYAAIMIALVAVVFSKRELAGGKDS